MNYLKKIFFVTIIFFVSVSNTFAHNTAFIDIDFILKNSSLGKSTINELNEKKSKELEIFKSKEKELQLQESQIKKKSNILKKEDLDKEINLLKIKINEFNIYKNDASEKFENEKKILMKNFFEKLNPIIEEYIDKNLIQILLNKKDIVMGQNNFDITNEIIEIIDKKFN